MNQYTKQYGDGTDGEPFVPSILLLALGVEAGEVSEMSAAKLLGLDVVSFREVKGRAIAHAIAVSARGSKLPLHVARDRAVSTHSSD